MGRPTLILAKGCASNDESDPHRFPPHDDMKQVVTEEATRLLKLPSSELFAKVTANDGV